MSDLAAAEKGDFAAENPGLANGKPAGLANGNSPGLINGKPPGLANGNLGVFFGFFGVFGRRWNDPKKSKFSVFFEKKGRKVGFWGVIMDN